jgi:acetyl-CoA acetyltransferase
MDGAMTAEPRMAIVGIGASDYARTVDSDASALAVTAVANACRDAGVSPADLDGLFSESKIMPDVVADLRAAFGLSPTVQSAHIGLIGSGSVAAAILARAVAMTGGGSLFACVFALSLSSVGGPGAYHESDPYKANLELPFGFYPQPVYMACMARRYFMKYGIEPDDLGFVPVSARQWAQLNPAAQRRDPLDIEGYRAAAPIAEPLRAEDCCLISDGAMAFVVTTMDRARDMAHSPIEILGVQRAVEPITEHEYLSVREDHTHLPSRFSAPGAFEQAGLAAADVDLVYLYDCFSIIPVLQLEDMGFCEPGSAVELFRSGATAPGGGRPVNTHGGLLAHSYLPGVNMVVEAVTQLRGDAEQGRQVRGATTAAIGAWAAQEHTTMILART